MTTPAPTLDGPLALPCGVTLANRVAKAALSEQLATADGHPTPRLIQLYRTWARSGAGLLFTGHVIVDGRSRGEPGNVVLEDDRALERFAAWAEAARAEGAHVWLQLNHVGRQAPRSLCAHPVAPSAVPLRIGRGVYAAPRALDEAEILDIIARFARAAALAQQAGFTGVAIHAAHGYLATQFLSPLTNQRTDRWGGPLEHRLRFLREVLRAVRAAVGPGFPVAVKLNSADFQRGGVEAEEALAVVAQVAAEGVDLIEISGGSFESLAMFGFDRGLGWGQRPQQALAPRTLAREAYFQAFARGARAHVRTPIMLTGGFRTAAAMREALADGATDMIGLGRPLILEPRLPAGLLDGSLDGALPQPPLGVGLASMESAAALAWYTSQLERLGRGLAPDLHLGPRRALLATFAKLGVEAFRPQRS